MAQLQGFRSLNSIKALSLVILSVILKSNFLLKPQVISLSYCYQKHEGSQIPSII